MPHQPPRRAGERNDARKGKRQKAKGKRRNASAPTFSLLPFSFCLRTAKGITRVADVTGLDHITSPRSPHVLSGGARGRLPDVGGLVAFWRCSPTISFTFVPT